MESPKQILERLYSILGQAVLLPIPKGQKGPALKGWPNITFAQSAQPDHQGQLIQALERGGNLGALLGPSSGGLIALDIDDDGLVPVVIDLHPWLAKTLRTRGARGCQFWFRLEPEAEFPRGQAILNLRNNQGEVYGELRLGGAGGAQSVLFGVHPKGMAYSIVVEAPALVISLADLYELCPELGHSSEPDIETDQAQGKEQEDDEPVFPYPEIDQSVFRGPFGRIIEAIKPLTEADPAALVVQLLVGWGNAIGRGPFFSVGPDKHYTNLNVCIVGKSGRSRKGLSLSVDRWILSQVDPKWEKENIRGGLSSGEGLIWQIRDSIIKSEAIKEKGRYTGARQDYVEDEGIKDKRLLIAETEFGGALTVMGRTGNTLSEVVRNAFDSKHKLGTLVKHSPAVVTDPHISIIGHITRFELRSRIKECEQTNGFVNRFLWICSRRHGVLPEPRDLAEAGLSRELSELIDTTVWAKKVAEMERDWQARELWDAIYNAFAEDEEESVVAASVDRGDVFMLRLSMIYALSEGSRIIKVEHVEAAQSLWRYAEASARHIFGKWALIPRRKRFSTICAKRPKA